jgi:hypothetical protein
MRRQHGTLTCEAKAQVAKLWALGRSHAELSSGSGRIAAKASALARCRGCREPVWLRPRKRRAHFLARVAELLLLSQQSVVIACSATEEIEAVAFKPRFGILWRVPGVSKLASLQCQANHRSRCAAVRMKLVVLRRVMRCLKDLRIPNVITPLFSCELKSDKVSH